MTIYMVQVVSAGGSVRYFDSFWAVEKTAQERMSQLVEQVRAGGARCSLGSAGDGVTWGVRLITAQVEDAALKEPA